TQQSCGRIPLVLGMPVVISQNFDVQGGIVNGSFGTLKRVHYRTDSQGRRHATSVIVHVDDSTDECLTDLPPHHVAVLEDTT
ncbi:hypothetical protein PENSPDRAFT_536827, partial [Peniophora sp. CONT]